MVEYKKMMSKFHSHSKVYRFSTENLTFMQNFDFEDKHILTVGGSGDQMIEAYRLGARKVTCFDINVSSQFFVELKLAALSSLTLNEFRTHMNKGLIHLYPKLKHLLTDSAIYYFEHHNDKIVFTTHAYKDLEKYIPYLSSEMLYENAKSKLPTNLAWYSLDIKSAINTLEGAWDIIMLSNLADYSHLMYENDFYHVEHFCNDNVKPLLAKLTSRGQLIYAYIYDCLNACNSDKRNCFNNPSIRNRVYGEITGFTNKELLLDSVMGDITKDAIVYLTADKENNL